MSPGAKESQTECIRDSELLRAWHREPVNTKGMIVLKTKNRALSVDQYDPDLTGIKLLFG